MVVRSLTVAALTIAACATALGACAPVEETDVAKGSAEIMVSVDEALVTAPLGRLDVKATGTGITTPITLTLSKTATGYSGTMDYIPPGTGRTFAASLYDVNGVIAFAGTATNVTIELGKTASVALVLQQAAQPTVTNTAPVITAVSASALEAVPGATITVGGTATDADGDALTFRWIATDGTFADATSASTVWTAGAGSATSTQTLTFTVTDARGATVRAPITVLAASSAFAPPASSAQ